MAKGIKLDGPFEGLLGYPQNIRSEKSAGRDYMYLYDPAKKKGRLMSMARFNMSMEMGEIPPPDLHADHMTEHRHDDDPSVLQLLTQAENNRKTVLARQGFIRRDEPQICCICGGEVFSSKVVVTCSRKCNGENLRRKMAANEIPSPPDAVGISEELRSQIRQLRSERKSSYYISEALGISRNTVMKYW